MQKENWKDIKGYEGKYQISDKGRVKNIRTGRILKPANQKGYLVAVLSKNNTQKNISVHRLVAQAFIPNTDNLPVVNHKDENQTNNCVDNLEWCTKAYNNNYGTRKERCRKAMLEKDTSKPIAQYTLDLPCSLIKVWPSTMEIVRQLGYSAGNIWSCCNGKYKQAYGYQWAYWEE